MHAARAASSTTAGATSTAATGTLTVNSKLKIVGIILAISSGLLIGSSFVFKKKGLLRSQAGGKLGEGVAYLKSPLWWLGMSMMIFGEICNFAAYAFVESLVVTPLGALSVVICAVLSSFFLNEKLTFFGWLGCGLCILGSVIIALNGPQEPTIGKIQVFQKLFLSPGFLSFAAVLIVAALVIIFYFAPRYGKKSMLWYIFVCSMIGGISVSVTTGLGAAIVQTAKGDNQFKFWFIYFLIVFIVVTLLVEVYYLNVALALFNTAMVTPTYYVIFTFFSMVTSIVLFQGLQAGAIQIITLVMGFLVICFGITILQMSKIDPEKLKKLDRRSTLLLQAARFQAGGVNENTGIPSEDPGIDALRGSFGTMGTIIRARNLRMSQMSHNTVRTGAIPPYDPATGSMSNSNANQLDYTYPNVLRHQSYGPPASRANIPSTRDSVLSQSNKPGTIAHPYKRPSTGDNTRTHGHRQAQESISSDVYPLLPPITESDRESNWFSTSPILQDTAAPQVIPQIPSPEAGQTLNVSPLITNEHVIYSAPAVIQGRFSRSDSPTPMRGDVIDPNPGRGSWLSFPFMAKLAPDEREPENMERKSQHIKKENSKGPLKSPKRYPGGSADDDEERSGILFSAATISSEGDNKVPTPQPPDVSGIQFVSINERQYF